MKYHQCIHVYIHGLHKQHLRLRTPSDMPIDTEMLLKVESDLVVLSEVAERAGLHTYLAVRSACGGLPPPQNLQEAVFRTDHKRPPFSKNRKQSKFSLLRCLGRNVVDAFSF